MMRTRLLGAVVALVAAAPVLAIEYQYDALDRLVRVVRDDGSEEAYTYDPAGNITSVTRRGRASVSIVAKVGFHEASCDQGDVYAFDGKKGETVTVRVEAEPREAGIGKRLTLTLKDKVPRAELLRRDGTVLPNEIAAVLPSDGAYEVIVQRDGEGPGHARYAGAYRLTLEARAETCATLAPRGKHP